MRESRHPRAPILGAISLVLIVGLAYAVTASPLFRAREMRVRGLDRLSESKVLHLAGVDSTTNILWLSGAKVRQRLEFSPWIDSASVSKSYPSTLTISVVERVPAAVIERGKQGYMVVAGDGIALQEAEGPGRLPVIAGLEILDLGQKLPASLLPAAEAAGDLNDVARAEVSKIVLADDGTLSMRLRSGAKIDFGPATELQAKADSLAGIIAWADENHSAIRYADLSAPSAPAAKVGKARGE